MPPKLEKKTDAVIQDDKSMNGSSKSAAEGTLSKPPTVITGTQIFQQLTLLNKTVQSHDAALDKLRDLPDLLKKMADQMEMMQHSEMESQPEGDFQEDLSNSPEVDAYDEIMKALDENNLNDDTDQEVLKLLNAFEPEIEYGPDVMPKVAESVSNILSKPITKENLESIKGRAKIPSNCKVMLVPKVNSEIWSNLPVKCKIADIKYQQQQQALSVGITNLVKIAHTLTTESKSLPNGPMKEMLRYSMDGISALGSAFQGLNGTRKLEIRPNLNKDYSGICSGKTPVSEWLFGDNLSDSLKATKVTSEIVRKTSVRPHDFKPYTRFPAKSIRPGHLNFNRPSFNNHRRSGGPYQYRQPMLPHQNQAQQQQRRF